MQGSQEPTTAAGFSSLPAGLVQEILSHLSLKEQGRAACVSKLCAAAVLPLAPALAHYVIAGDFLAVRRLLQKPDARLGLDYPSCELGRTPVLQCSDPKQSCDFGCAAAQSRRRD